MKWKTLKKDQRKGRELDPRYYNVEEEREFRMADAKEWKSFMDIGAVTVIPPHLAKKVDPSRIFDRNAILSTQTKIACKEICLLNIR